MYWDITKVLPQDDYNLYVELQNGTTGIFDMKPLINTPFFHKLRNADYFKSVTIVLGALTWPNEEDVDPEIVMQSLKVKDDLLVK
ncbi:MAG: DUF2442 domain-containing protein [Bacteroidia bacterium]|nr:DUF2442 domain-containing protein [Bacteroidia bacterium]